MYNKVNNNEIINYTSKIIIFYQYRKDTFNEIKIIYFILFLCLVI